MIRTLNSPKLVKHIVVLFSLVAWQISAVAQPVVDICLYNSGDGKLEVRLQPDGNFNGVVSNVIFTLRWDSASGVNVGAVEQQFPEVAYIPTFKSGPEVDSLGYTHQVFFGTGFSPMSTFGASWTVGQEVVLMQIPVTNPSGDFQITNDDWTNQIRNNGDYFVSLSGRNRTGLTCDSLVNFCQGLDLSAVVTNADCPGATGSIDLTVSSGQAPFSYVWSNGDSTQDLASVAPGIYTVIVGDAQTCADTLTDTVFAEPDMVAPLITCPPNVQAAADQSNCDALVDLGVAQASDSCGVVSIINSYTNTGDADAIYTVGSTEIIWTASDASNNNSTCSMTVTVVDTIAPQLTCLPDTTFNTDSGDCSAIVAIAAPSASDACGLLSLINDFTNTADASGVYAHGSTVITWTATDSNGNQSVCIQTITVNDRENPQINCGADAGFVLDANSCVIQLNFAQSTSATDNCGIEQIVNDRTGTADASGTYGVGVHALLWTATDSSGNSSQCMQTVSIFDTIAPLLACLPDSIFENDSADCGANLLLASPSASDACGLQSLTNDLTGTSDASSVYALGSTLITWTATDSNGNQSVCAHTITVIDSENPQISCGADTTIVLDANSCEIQVNLGQSATATDNCGVQQIINDRTGTADASGTYGVGVHSILWTATDSSANTAQCTQSITVIDSIAPAVVCPSDSIYDTDSGSCNASIVIGIPIATDACGLQSLTNDLTNTADASGVYAHGSTIITWTATDSNSNQSICSHTITIRDIELPQIVCSPDTSIILDSTSCSLQINFATTTTAADNCGLLSIINSRTGTSDASGLFSSGAHEIFWTATDSSGNAVSCTQSVSLFDRVAPLIACPNDIVQANDPGKCKALVTVPLPVASDNCTLQRVSNDHTGGANASGGYDVGTTTVTWFASDNQANTNQCSHTVTIVDSESPVINCPDSILASTSAQSCSTGVNLSIPQVSDNCSVQSLTNDYNGRADASDLYLPGATTVIFTATDSLGNSGVCTTMIIVTDTVAPVAVCPADTALCQTNYSYAVTASDNCDQAVVSQIAGLPSGSEFPVGITANRFVVTDAAGFTDTCSFNLTVNAGAGSTINPKISATMGSFNGNLDKLDQFGGAVAFVDDLDGDGNIDLAVGAPITTTFRDNAGFPEKVKRSGALWLLFLNADGTVREHVKISADSGNIDPSIFGVKYLFGSAVDDLGDLDGDGVRDLAVGMPGYAPNKKLKFSGGVAILFMHADGTVKSHQIIAHGVGGFPEVLQKKFNFGSAVTNLGDLDGDGIVDIAVGTPSDDNTPGAKIKKSGSVWLLNLNTDGTVLAHSRISAGSFPAGVIEKKDAFGTSLANTGDFDNNGLIDIAIGAPQDDDTTKDAGKVYLVNLNTDGSIATYTTLSTDSSIGLTPDKKDFFGWSVAGGADFNDDGTNDLLIGAPKSDRVDKDAGAAYIVQLNSAGQATATGFVNPGIIDKKDYFGSSMDVNAGDCADLTAVGAVWDDDGAKNAGAVYLGYQGALARPKSRQSQENMIVRLENAIEPSTQAKNDRGFDQAAIQINLYPNPFSDQLHVSSNLWANEQADLRLYRLTGEHVLQTQISRSNQQINTSHISPGTYLIRIENERVSIGGIVVLVR